MQPKIEDDLKQAQLARDETKVSVLRMLLSELRYAQIAKGGELNDQDIRAVIQKELKKRREAADAFRQGNRAEQAAKEETEGKVLEGYLPAQLTDEELTKIVEASITELGANSIQDMGRVIGGVMSKTAGKADGARVSAVVKEKLSS